MKSEIHIMKNMKSKQQYNSILIKDRYKEIYWDMHKDLNPPQYVNIKCYGCKKSYIVRDSEKSWRTLCYKCYNLHCKYLSYMTTTKKYDGSFCLDDNKVKKCNRVDCSYCRDDAQEEYLFID